MFSVALSVFSLLSIFTPYTKASALPTTESIRQFEIIPGPGLPSLESLGLTAADLYNMAARDISANPQDINRRQAAQNCFNVGDGGVPDGNAQACINYLNSLPASQQCGVSGDLTDETIFCYSGVARLYGYNLSPYPGTSTLCSNVVTGLNWVMGNCGSDGLVAGEAAAYGDGYMQVGISQY